MKTLLTVGGLGSALTAATAAGGPTLLLAGVAFLVLAGLSCWIISNRGRTENTVALIIAARTRNPITPRVLRQRRGRREA